MKILVIGATGTVGSEVVSQLLTSGVQVRAVSRTADPARGVEVMRGDLTAPETLDPALDGVESVFLVWTAPASAIAAAIDRITSRVPRIVLVSAPHQTPHPFFQQPNPMAAMFREIERLIRDSKASWTFVRPGMFAANALTWWAPQIRKGDVVRWPYASAATAPIHERDIAEVSVRALLDRAHIGGDYVITGPESLTQREQVNVIGDAIGRRLTFEEMSRDEAHREFGAPPAVVDMLLNAWAAAVGIPAYVTNTVADITGHPARTFREWVRDHESDFVIGSTHA